ncbi:MAG: argininosuccinate lyase [Anaerolineales bacterium]|nr:MAG: argininosuccinate lyase [Anaerolineales bacterium]
MAMALWGGRFTESTDEHVRCFGDSISFDHKLYAVDIQGSIAYVSALERAGCITSDERDQLIGGLQKVRKEFDDGTFRFQPADEDIHTAVERRLDELLGSVAGKLHTGRSRNDQVATDLRLYLLSQITSLQGALTQVQEAIVENAEAHLDVIMPGYTHLQQAQPLLFSHWLLSFFWKLQRDQDRLADVERRTAVMPLGSGAIAGHPFGIDRQALAIDLGFKTVTENSVDAVSDRDYVVEFLAWAALLQVHLSSLAEDLIIWASREFDFVELHDAYCTGSSLMPQKKNPDTAELIRGKAGRITGHLVAMLTVLKGLPSGYNKDLQEDKEKVFDVIDTLTLELSIAAGLIRTLEVNEARMARALDGTMLATDLADYLVQKGLPFRQSHELVGLTVKRAEALGVPLAELGLDEYQAIHPAFAKDLYQVFDFRRSITRRRALGGTAREAVLAQIRAAKALLTG